MEENREVITTFWYSMSHKRYEQGQFIGVDMNFVIEVMKILEVKNRRRCLDGVMKLVNYVIENTKN